MSVTVRVIEAPRMVVIVRPEGAPAIRIHASPPPASVRVMAEGTQGPRGLAGPPFDIFSLPLAPTN